MLIDDRVKLVASSIREKLLEDNTGHDWYHAYRVYKNSIFIAKNEPTLKADILIVSLSALLHDIADHKFGYTDEDRTKIISTCLSACSVDDLIIRKVVCTVEEISFSKGKTITSPESAIVQDADRLDAIGAIGIARTFAYGGHKNRPMYSIGEDDTVSHFYEKLFRLKDLMNTQTGKKIANDRHNFMEVFIEHFYNEWYSEKLTEEERKQWKFDL